MYFLRIITVVSYVVVSAQAAELPPFLKVCSRDDPDVDNCIEQSLEALKPHLRTGEPDYNIPSVEPIYIKELMREESGGLKISTTEVIASGGSEYIIERIHLDVDKLILEAKMTIPKLSIEAQYDMDGKILVLPLKGNGKFYANMTDCKTKTTIQLKVFKGDDGEEHIKIDSNKMSIKVGSGTVKFDNMFGTDTKINEIINDTINRSLDAFMKELMPVIERALAAKFMEIGNSIVSPYTYSQLFPTH